MSYPFDYNNMPLSPLGCQVQVHKKTYKRGTWAFHSLDGWYIATSPDHYCVHKCHIKETHSKHFSYRVQFQHKSIINPTITHGKKIIRDIAECTKVIQGLGEGKSKQEIKYLRRLVDATKNFIGRDPNFMEREVASKMQQSAQIMQPFPRVQPLLRVHKTPHNHYQRMTHSLAASTPTHVPNAQRHRTLHWQHHGYALASDAQLRTLRPTLHQATRAPKSPPHI